MGSRKVPLADGENYHVFNRGVDKRAIFSDEYDLERFFMSMHLFNDKNPIGSVFEANFHDIDPNRQTLVDILAYCLLPNHFHLILQQKTEGGISEYMKRLLGGYTWYFNNRNKRSGALFQGRYKSVHIETNEHLLYTSAYVLLNHRQMDDPNLAELGGPTAKLVRSGWWEYTGKENILPTELVFQKSICTGTGIVLDQFKNKDEYAKFAFSVLETIKENKVKYAELEN